MTCAVKPCVGSCGHKRANVTENQINKSLVRSPFTFDLFPDHITASVRWEGHNQACTAVFTEFQLALEVIQLVKYLVGHMWVPGWNEALLLE